MMWRLWIEQNKKTILYSKKLSKSYIKKNDTNKKYCDLISIIENTPMIVEFRYNGYQPFDTIYIIATVIIR